jgi:protein-tyrosine phosphatase
VLLVLGILDVPDLAIQHDYALTDAELMADREERLAEIREIGLTEDWGSTVNDFVERVFGHLDQTYGGLDGYLNSIGFTKVERVALRERLLY